MNRVLCEHETSFVHSGALIGSTIQMSAEMLVCNEEDIPKWTCDDEMRSLAHDAQVCFESSRPHSIFRCSSDTTAHRKLYKSANL